MTKAIYSNPIFLEKLEKLYPIKNIEVLPLIVGARKGWYSEYREQIVGASDADVDDLIHKALRGGCIIHKQFNRVVWRSARKVHV